MFLVLSEMPMNSQRLDVYGQRPTRETWGDPPRRMVLFSDHLRRAAELNARPNKSWTAGVTPLADYLAQAGHLEPLGRMVPSGKLT